MIEFAAHYGATFTSSAEHFGWLARFDNVNVDLHGPR